jgi:hypothetical protein
VVQKIVNGLSIVSLVFTAYGFLSLAYFNIRAWALLVVLWLLSVFALKPADEWTASLGRRMTTLKFTVGLLFYGTYAGLSAASLWHLDGLPDWGALRAVLWWGLLGTVVLNFFHWAMWLKDQFRGVPSGGGSDPDGKEPVPIDAFRPKLPPGSGAAEEMKLAA